MTDRAKDLFIEMDTMGNCIGVKGFTTKKGFKEQIKGLAKFFNERNTK